MEMQRPGQEGSCVFEDLKEGQCEGSKRCKEGGADPGHSLWDFRDFLLITVARGRLLSTCTTEYWANCAACARALVFLIYQAIVIKILTFQNTERTLPAEHFPQTCSLF